MAKAAKTDDDKLWTIDDLAAYLRTTREVAYKTYRKERIPRVAVGRRVLFLPSVVKRWANSRVVKGN
jgi:excisionase family DNA binding protein